MDPSVHAPDLDLFAMRNNHHGWVEGMPELWRRSENQMKTVLLSDVERAINVPQLYSSKATIPTYMDNEWYKDHTNYVVGVIIPKMRLSKKLRRIAIEAYLSGYELKSDGSSVIPDEWNWKDIWGVMHDYIFWLHRQRLADAYGHVWTLAEANAAYRDGWIASGHKVRGWAWWCGLTLGSWTVWNRRK